MISCWPGRNGEAEAVEEQPFEVHPRGTYLAQSRTASADPSTRRGFPRAQWDVGGPIPLERATTAPDRTGTWVLERFQLRKELRRRPSAGWPASGTRGGPSWSGSTTPTARRGPGGRRTPSARSSSARRGGGARPTRGSSGTSPTGPRATGGSWSPSTSTARRSRNPAHHVALSAAGNRLGPPGVRRSRGLPRRRRRPRRRAPGQRDRVARRRRAGQARARRLRPRRPDRRAGGAGPRVPADHRPRAARDGPAHGVGQSARGRRAALPAARRALPVHRGAGPGPGRQANRAAPGARPVRAGPPPAARARGNRAAATSPLPEARFASVGELGQRLAAVEYLPQRDWVRVSASISQSRRSIGSRRRRMLRSSRAPARRS